MPDGFGEEAALGVVTLAVSAPIVGAIGYIFLRSVAENPLDFIAPIVLAGMYAGIGLYVRSMVRRARRKRALRRRR